VGLTPIGSDPVGRLDRLVVRVGTRSIPIEVNSATAFFADGNYAEVLVDGRRVHARITMAELHRRLDSSRFVRVHRSAIVAVSAVRELRTPRGRGASLVLGDGTVVPVSPTGRRALGARLGRPA
jgi:two-component system, LytTR family, response regulator